MVDGSEKTSQGGLPPAVRTKGKPSPACNGGDIWRNTGAVRLPSPD